MMNAWLLFNRLTTLSRHTPASQLYQEDLIQDETADQDFDVFRWNIFIAANTKQGCIFYNGDESTLKQTN